MWQQKLIADKLQRLSQEAKIVQELIYTHVNFKIPEALHINIPNNKNKVLRRKYRSQFSTLYSTYISGEYSPGINI